MIDIDRINYLARKAKTQGLTPQEKEEQAKLRRAYIDSVVGNMRAQLDNTYIQKDGKIVSLSAHKDDEE